MSRVARIHGRTKEKEVPISVMMGYESSIRDGKPNRKERDNWHCRWSRWPNWQCIPRISCSTAEMVSNEEWLRDANSNLHEEIKYWALGQLMHQYAPACRLTMQPSLPKSHHKENPLDKDHCRIGVDGPVHFGRLRHRTDENTWSWLICHYASWT